ncbi:hypothetical protein AB4254_08555 [Vibrio breoganii]
MTKQQKLFYVYRCHQHPRGSYLIYSPTKTAAAKTIGCSLYHLNNYSHDITHKIGDEPNEAEMTKQDLTMAAGVAKAIASPGEALHREGVLEPWINLAEKRAIEKEKLRHLHKEIGL